jgi:hypothetical protein
MRVMQAGWKKLLTRRCLQLTRGRPRKVTRIAPSIFSHGQILSHVPKVRAGQRARQRAVLHGGCMEIPRTVHYVDIPHPLKILHQGIGGTGSASFPSTVYPTWPSVLSRRTSLASRLPMMHGLRYDMEPHPLAAIPYHDYSRVLTKEFVAWIQIAEDFGTGDRDRIVEADVFHCSN